MTSLRLLIRSIVFFSLFFTVLFYTQKVSAQTCSGTRIINQYACVSSPALCQGYSYKCLYSTKPCTPALAGSCGPTEGACSSMCDGWLPAGPQTCSSTGSQIVSCSSAPTCTFNGTIITCSGGGGSNGACQESGQSLTYGCWVNGSSGGGGGSSGGGGYGACGSCSGCPGTNQTQCRTDPGGACVWDPSGCGQGSSGPPPPSYVSQYFVSNFANAYPAAAIGSTTVNTIIYPVAYPVNMSCNSKVVFTILAGSGVFTGPSGNVANSYWYYNPTAPHFWGVALKPTAPGILVVRAEAFQTCPGYEVSWSITDASIIVNPAPVPPVACIAPVPNDPAPGACAASPTTPTVVSWSWLAVPFADTYNFTILDQNNATVIAAADHTAASLGCAAGGTCTLPVSLLPGTYHSLVKAHSSTGACTPDSVVGRSQDYQLNTCSSTVTMTLEQDPSITGGTQATLTGSGPTAQCTSPSSGAAYSGGGAIKAQSITPANTYLGTVTGSTATINNVPNGTNNYNITFSPLNNYYCTCPAGCTYSTKTVPLNPPLKFYVSPVTENWFQTIGGDTAALGVAGTVVDDPIPAPFCTTSGCSPYFSLPLVSGKPETAGSLLITNGGSADLKSTTTGTQDDNVSNPSHLVTVNKNNAPQLRESYDYFYRLFSLGLSPSDDFGIPTNAQKPLAAPANGKAAYFHNGNLAIDTPWAVSASDEIVVFVSGNLTINKNITLAKGGFVAFIVKGDITITKDVGTATQPFAAQTTNGQVQGMYFADGSLTVASTNDFAVADKKFIGEGTFAAKNGISLPRDFRFGNNGVENNAGPASLFIYRPDLIQNAPEKMKAPTYIWKEVSP